MTAAISPTRSLPIVTPHATVLNESELKETGVRKGLKVSDFCKIFERSYKYPLDCLTNCESLDEVELFFLGDCHILPEFKLNNTRLIQLLWNENRKTVFHEAPRSYTSPPQSIVTSDLNPKIRYQGWDDQTDLCATLFNHSDSLLVHLYNAGAFIERIRHVIERDLKAPFRKGSTHDSLEIITRELEVIFKEKRKELESYIATTPQLKSLYKLCITHTPYPQNPHRLLNCAKLLCFLALDKQEKFITVDTWKTRQRSLCTTLLENGQRGFVLAGDSHFIDTSSKDELQIEKSLKKHFHSYRVKYCIIVPRLTEILSARRFANPRNTDIHLSFRSEKPPTTSTNKYHTLDQIFGCKADNLAYILHYFYEPLTGAKLPDPLLGKRAIVYMRQVRELLEKDKKPLKLVKLQKRFNKRHVRLNQIKLILKDRIKFKYPIKQVRDIRKQHIRTNLLLKKLAKQIQS